MQSEGQWTLFIVKLWHKNLGTRTDFTNTSTVLRRQSSSPIRQPLKTFEYNMTHSAITGECSVRMDHRPTASVSRWLYIPETLNESRHLEGHLQPGALGPQCQPHLRRSTKLDTENNNHVWIIEETKFSYRTMVQMVLVSKILFDGIVFMPVYLIWNETLLIIFRGLVLRVVRYVVNNSTIVFNHFLCTHSHTLNQGGGRQEALGRKKMQKNFL